VLGKRPEAEELFDIAEQLGSGSFNIDQIGARLVEVLESLEMGQDEEASWYYGVGAVMGIISESSYRQDGETMLEALEIAIEAGEYAPETVPSEVLEALARLDAALAQEMDEGTYDEIGLIASNVMEAISPGHNG
jgi:hypothetical protein